MLIFFILAEMELHKIDTRWMTAVKMQQMVHHLTGTGSMQYMLNMMNCKRNILEVFSENIIFMLHRLIQHHATQFGLILHSLHGVGQHGETQK
jgi:hypothetical protein